MSKVEKKTDTIRLVQPDALKLATTPGLGHHFLNSIGHSREGGPNKRLLLQISPLDPQDLPIPGEPYSFSVLKLVQGLGDVQSLQTRKRRACRAILSEDVNAGLERFFKSGHRRRPQGSGAIAS